MLKKGLLIVAAVAMLAGAAQAGEIKLHVWPCAFIPQDFMTIPVTMDIGYWIRVKSQSKYIIKLTQIDTHTYDGCVTIPVETNFNATLSCKIAKVNGTDGKPLVDGTYSCTIDIPNIVLGTTNVKVCAHIANADLSKLAGGTKDVQVGVVTIQVVPTLGTGQPPCIAPTV